MELFSHRKEGEIKGMIIVSKDEKGGDYVGDWRFNFPVVDYEKCTGCLLCSMYCPEAAIVADEEGKPEIDMRFCKGCGVCVNECPVKIIKMKEEEK